MKLIRSLSVSVVLAAVVFATVNCGGLSATCQKALDCCQAVQKAEGQSGDEVKVSCQTGGTDFSVTAKCSQIPTTNSVGGTLAEAGCSALKTSLTSTLGTCKKTVPAVCN